jgi:hypothetical protein
MGKKLKGTYALVDGVPDLVGSRVECTGCEIPKLAIASMRKGSSYCDVHLKSKGTGEDGGEEDRVPLEKGAKLSQCMSAMLVQLEARCSVVSSRRSETCR